MLVTLCVASALTLCACEPTLVEETTLFEEAEDRCAQGDYHGATVLYERFLEQHPLSPLATISEQRIRTMERELDAIMNRRNAPSPVYVNPFGSAPLHEVEARPLRDIHAPSLPTLED